MVPPSSFVAARAAHSTLSNRYRYASFTAATFPLTHHSPLPDQLPPIELSTSPPLRTPRGTQPLEKRVYPEHLVGFSISRTSLKWMDDRQLGLDLNKNTRLRLTISGITKRLPVGHRRLTSIYDKDGQYNLCWVVGTSLRPQDLENARNMALIDQYRSILGVKTAPQWYRPAL